MQTAILYGIINMLHKLFYFANHCLAVVMTLNVSCMRHSGIMKCSVYDIRRSGRQCVASLCPHWSNSSGCLSVVSVTILAKLDRRCDHEVEWQDLLVSGTSSLLLVNA